MLPHGEGYDNEKDGVLRAVVLSVQTLNADYLIQFVPGNQSLWQNVPDK